MKKTFKFIGGGTSWVDTQAWNMECDDMYEAEDGERIVILSHRETHWKMPKMVTIEFRDKE